MESVLELGLRDLHRIGPFLNKPASRLTFEYLATALKDTTNCVCYGVEVYECSHLKNVLVQVLLPSEGLWAGVGVLRDYFDLDSVVHAVAGGRTRGCEEFALSYTSMDAGQEAATSWRDLQRSAIKLASYQVARWDKKASILFKEHSLSQYSINEANHWVRFSL